ncbi:hypothetical protein CGC21_29800 [Leishmania donovani]|uniref:Uncharacterized protein n=1 Tax=Leishmania donovani TaxID=5661 RepID=A0A504X2G2_LEIDO|nr:hypothetical protein CGC21_29800 [Leishmania donovani]
MTGASQISSDSKHKSGGASAAGLLKLNPLTRSPFLLRWMPQFMLVGWLTLHPCSHVRQCPVHLQYAQFSVLHGVRVPSTILAMQPVQCIALHSFSVLDVRVPLATMEVVLLLLLFEEESV